MRMKLRGDGQSPAQPKLALSTLPSHHKTAAEPPLGLVTPPLYPMASVPFHWEEVPGRPRSRPNKTVSPSPMGKPKSARLLQLPPRLMPSPTTVLGGLEEEDRPCSCDGGSGRKEGEIVEGSLDFLASSRRAAKITRLRRRRRGLFGFSTRCCQLLGNIRGSLKQLMMCPNAMHGEAKSRGRKG